MKILYPGMTCASCLLEPQMDTVLHHDHIEVMTLTEILEIKGSLGNFLVKVKQEPRFVDQDVCIGCGACFEACPVSVPVSFLGGASNRKAIHIPYAGAVPNVAVIDKKNCLRFRGEACRSCQEACSFGAIRFGETDGIREIKVGAVVVATGFASFDPGKDHRYGYGEIENILTSLEFEQLVNSTGPTEGKILLGDGDLPGASRLSIALGRGRKTSMNIVPAFAACISLNTHTRPEHSYRKRPYASFMRICVFLEKHPGFSIGRSGKRMMFISFACCSPILLRSEKVRKGL